MKEAPLPLKALIPSRGRINVRLTVLCAVAAALVLFAAELWTGHSTVTQGPGAERIVAPDEVPGPLAPRLVEPPRPAQARATLDAEPATADPAAHPWFALLAGLTGRVVEEDGMPVVGMRVELIEGDPQLLLDAAHTPLGRPGLSVAETTTGTDGRFTIQGSVPNAMHILVLDDGAGRAAMRIIGQAFHNGAVTDMGDIVLPRCGTVSGTVLDEDGEPVAGARVRLGAIPEVVLQSGVLDLRERCWVFDGWWGSEVSALALEVLERLPISTTVTDAEGTFQMTGVPLALVTGGVDKQGYVATIIPPFELRSGGRDLGEIDLEVGRVIRGQVVDSLGKPVAGAHVRAGVLHPAFDVAFFQPASGALAVSDEQGRYEVPGIGELGEAFAVARRQYGDSWVHGEAGEGSANVEIVLPMVAPLTIRVRDTAGVPIGGASVTVHRVLNERDDWHAEAASVLTVRGPANSFEFTETEPGLYVVSDLTLGEWTVRAKAGGMATAEVVVDHQMEAGSCELVCRAGRMITVTVIDASTHEIVPFAYARILEEGGHPYDVIDADFTGADGRVQLGPIARADELAEDGPTDDEPDAAAEDSSFHILVEYPGYSSHGQVLPNTGEAITVELSRALHLNGRITCAGAVPSESYLVVLTVSFLDGGDVEDAFTWPTSALSSPEGEFRFTGLSAGSYEVSVYQRPTTDDPIGFLLKAVLPDLVHEAYVEVQPSLNEWLAIDLGARGDGPMASFAGRVRVNGELVAGARVMITGATDMELVTDANGEFSSRSVSVVDGYWVKIWADVTVPGGSTCGRRLLNDYVSPKPGVVHRIDVDRVYEFVSLTIEVVALRTGEPVRGAYVLMIDGCDARTTGSDGRVETAVEGHGTHYVNIEAAGYVNFFGVVDLDTGGGAPEFRMELTPSVLCAGRVVLPSRFLGKSKAPSVQFHHTFTERVFWAVVDAKTLTFEVDGLLEGDYMAEVWEGDERIGTVAIRIGPAGDKSVVLDVSKEK